MTVNHNVQTASTCSAMMVHLPLMFVSATNSTHDGCSRLECLHRKLEYEATVQHALTLQSVKNLATL